MSDSTGAPMVAGIILAAGEGSRMGGTKQLLSFRGRSMLECVIDAALSSRLHRVVVVLGHQAETILPLLEKYPVTTVVNPEYRKGQSGSLKVGLGALEPETEAALFLLGDQPLITPRLIDQLLAGYQETRCPIVAPAFQGRRGNPVLFGRETFPRIAELTGDCGARPLFEEFADRVLTLPVDDPHIIFDVDTAEDYEALLNREPESRR